MLIHQLFDPGLASFCLRHQLSIMFESLLVAEVIDQGAEAVRRDRFRWRLYADGRGRCGLRRLEIGIRAGDGSRKHPLRLWGMRQFCRTQSHSSHQIGTADDAHQPPVLHHWKPFDAVTEKQAGNFGKIGGFASLGGRPIHRPGQDRGVVFQEHRLLPWLTVEQNIRFGLSRLPEAEKADRTRQQLELVGLSGFAKAYPNQLSGGMAQRVAIARALASQPKTLLLDEPFGALDALTKIQMQNEVLRIWQAERTTMVLVTHDIDEAIFLADQILVLSSRPGRVKSLYPISLPRPRDRSSPDFMALRKSIFREFFNETEAPFAYEI